VNLEVNESSANAQNQFVNGMLVVGGVKLLELYLKFSTLNLVETLWLVFVLWSLTKNKNWARLFIFLAALCLLVGAPTYAIVAWHAIWNSDSGNADFRALLLVAHIGSMLCLAYLLLTPEGRAFYKAGPPKQGSRQLAIGIAMAALALGIIVRLPYVRGLYASQQTHLFERQRREAQKYTDISLPLWGDASPPTDVNGIQVLRFLRVPEGQAAFLLVGPASENIPVEEIMASVKPMSYVPVSIFSQQIQSKIGPVTLDKVRCGKSWPGDPSGLMARLTIRGHNIVAIGCAPGGLAGGLSRQFSNELFIDFLNRLIAANTETRP